MNKPSINVIKPDISTTCILLLGVPKWGKSTLFRDIVLAKYDDPRYGLLVSVGNEHGAAMLDQLNHVHIDDMRDVKELLDYLANDPDGKLIKLVALDTGDELPDIFSNAIVMQYNSENPTKPVKSILQVDGGFNRGPAKASRAMISFLQKIRDLGKGVVVISHSKLRNVTDKTSIDDDQWQQLTTKIPNPYGDDLKGFVDAIVVGNIDREFTTIGEGENTRKVLAHEERRLWLRGTTLIDAGGRFARGAIVDYLTVGDDGLAFAKEFIKAIEEGMERSRMMPASAAPAPVVEPVVEDVEVPVIETITIDDVRDEVKALYQNAANNNRALAASVGAEIKAMGGLNELTIDQLLEVKEKLRK